MLKICEEDEKTWKKSRKPTSKISKDKHMKMNTTIWKKKKKKAWTLLIGLFPATIAGLPSSPSQVLQCTVHCKWQQGSASFTKNQW
jgi:hypothetical protein